MMLRAESGQIGQFLAAVFPYADEDSYISFRAFDQFERGGPAIFVETMQVGRDMEAVARRASALAERAANHARPVVFAPPVATFSNPRNAATIDLANGVAISVDIDTSDPEVGRKRLEHILGPVTMAVHSGGEWTDQETGEIVPKVHVHWRLSEPTRTADEHAKLREARYLAAILAGADTTAAPVAHPLRWPGSWNLKAKPRLATIAAGNPASEVHLDDALEKLQLAVEAAGLGRDVTAAPKVSSDPQASLALLSSALEAIPNADAHWEEWNRIGMAMWRAAGGSADGLKAWADWSAKSGKHEEAACAARWTHYGISPPTRIGAGTVFLMATRAGWERPGRPEEDAPPDDPAEYWQAVLAETDAREEAQEPTSDRKPLPPKPRKSTLPLVWFEAIEPCLDVLDFVQGVLIEQGAAVVYGESNAGKTFWTTDLALHVAANLEWNGRRVEGGGVIYCVLEGGAGFRNRVAAWRRSKGLDGERVPFAAVQSALNLLDPNADTPNLIAAIQAATEEICGPVKLVVIDTLSRALAGGNENAPEDMGALVRNMDLIREETGAAVLFVHHSGKDQAKGARGHSLLRAAIDTEIEVVAEEGTEAKQATVVKQRELKKGDTFGFTLDVVELGKNRRGEPVTTCLVKPEDGDHPEPIARRDTRGPTATAQLGARALRIAIGKSGAFLPETADYPRRTMAVSASVWRDEFYQLKGASPDNNRQAFNRSETALLASNTITERNGLVWFVRDQA